MELYKSYRFIVVIVVTTQAYFIQYEPSNVLSIDYNNQFSLYICTSVPNCKKPLT